MRLLSRLFHWITTAQPNDRNLQTLSRIEKAKEELPSMRVDEHGTLTIGARDAMKSKEYNRKCKLASDIIREQEGE